MFIIIYQYDLFCFIQETQYMESAHDYPKENNNE